MLPGKIFLFKGEIKKLLVKQLRNNFMENNISKQNSKLKTE